MFSLACLEGRLVAGGTKGSKKAGQGGGIDFDLLLRCFPGIVYQAATIEDGPLLLRGCVEEITGYSIEELAGGTGWRTAVHPDDIGFVKEAAARVLSGERPVGDIQFRILRKDGSVRWARNVF